MLVCLSISSHSISFHYYFIFIFFPMNHSPNLNSLSLTRFLSFTATQLNHFTAVNNIESQTYYYHLQTGVKRKIIPYHWYVPAHWYPLLNCTEQHYCNCNVMCNVLFETKINLTESHSPFLTWNLLNELLATTLFSLQLILMKPHNGFVCLTSVHRTTFCEQHSVCLWATITITPVDVFII